MESHSNRLIPELLFRSVVSNLTALQLMELYYFYGWHAKNYPLKKSALLLLICSLFLASFSSMAQGKVTGTDLFVTDPSIHSVLFFTEGWEFSLPVFELGSTQRLICKFDHLSREAKNYQYTLVHCDTDWNPSRITPTEYLEGFAENPVNDYAFSSNTTVPYVNYKLTLPNDQVKIRLSGNYLLNIWEEGNKDHPVLVRPFFVSEKLVSISGEIQKATYEGYSGASQQVAFTVNYSKLIITDPVNEIKAVVMQNSRWDNRLSRLKPTFIRPNQLVYEDKTNLFKGGNEFRNFDAKNLQNNGMGVHSIEFRDPMFYLTLEPDKSRRNDIYRTWNDLNGNYLVKNDRASDSDLESDYMEVSFSLIPPDLVTNDPVYLFGALTDWQCLPENQMVYNPDTKRYELKILEKQGFYDYQYVVRDKTNQSLDAALMEGSHVETENNYHFFVYFRGFAARYDRLIGYRMINSVQR